MTKAREERVHCIVTGRAGAGRIESIETYTRSALLAGIPAEEHKEVEDMASVVAAWMDAQAQELDFSGDVHTFIEETPDNAVLLRRLADRIAPPKVTP